MMNQPLMRVDPLGRSAALTETRPTAPRAPAPMTGSVWPICGGSVRAIVDTFGEHAKQHHAGTRGAIDPPTTFSMRFPTSYGFSENCIYGPSLE